MFIENKNFSAAENFCKNRTKILKAIREHNKSQRKIAEIKKQEEERTSGIFRCNGDCFNCVYDDCMASYQTIMKFEKAEKKEKQKQKKEKEKNKENVED